MSRSFIKTPAIKRAGTSDKSSRTSANKKMRRQNKIILNKKNICLEDIMFKTLREVSDTWGFKSDGLACYQSSLDSKYKRK